MEGDLLSRIVLVLVPLILCLSVHEWAHAITAYRLGDDTAARQGRLTLNPLPHIDPVGTIILPIALVVMDASFFFGWANPVPVNASRFKKGVNMKKGMLITAAAGPLSNLIMAMVCAVGLKVSISAGWTNDAVLQLLTVMFYLNIVLAIFNMIPVPPLDGNRVLVGLMSDRMERGYIKFLAENPYVVPLAFMGIIAFGGELIAAPIQWIGATLLALVGLS